MGLYLTLPEPLVATDTAQGQQRPVKQARPGEAMRSQHTHHRRWKGGCHAGRLLQERVDASHEGATTMVITNTMIDARTELTLRRAGRTRRHLELRRVGRTPNEARSHVGTPEQTDKTRVRVLI